MKSVFKFIVDHPLVTIAYSFYITFWILIAIISYRFHQVPANQRFNIGEVLGLGYFLLIRLSALYLIVTLLLAFFLKRHRLLYLKLSLLIIIPAAIMSVIGFW
jgi:hypothetical protein